ncbi:prostatic acid phosphatase, partial [Asbolus verrucosus]
ELLSVVVIYRHGDRTPIQPYPTDPYRNASYWPVGFGQLTNIGKWEHYQLGKWLRVRYNGFLPSRYSEKDFYLRSTDADRTLMSAEANLAGLYPPRSDQIWDPDIPWQPIPIHTEPELEDNLLSMKKDCPKYDMLLNELFESPYFVNISRRNHDLYAYLTKNSGTLISTLENLEYIYNTLFIETLYNFTLPAWTRAVFPDKMKQWADLSFATSCYNQDLARLKSGPLFDAIIKHFRNATANATDYRKFLVFSGHDVTIANVLNTMGAFQYHCPPYASTILFELRKSNLNYYVNVFYKNSSQLQNVTLKGCKFDCDLDDFVQILQPVAITRAEWDIECQLGWSYFFRFDNLQFLVLFSAAVSFLFVTFCVLLGVKCFRRFHKEGATVYMQLPNDEVA